ncbi:hypothetical protein [Arthrobacter sp. 92]|uniref:hypothetical protein n=1 Tax=Arthrobacter sp. 92 TaxID=3418175 RepID=UPI003D0379D2
MRAREAISFTFPEIQEFQDRLVRRTLLSLSCWLMLILATIGTKLGLGDGPYLLAVLVFGGCQLALSLAYWSRQNKLTPRLSQRFAVEFMLRTGNPAAPEGLDILKVKQTVAARDEHGQPRLWTIKRRGEVFTVVPT